MTTKYTQEQLDAVIHEGPLGFKVNALAAALLDARAELDDSRELHAKTVSDLRKLNDATQESLIGVRQQRDWAQVQLRETQGWLERATAKLEAARTYNELLVILGDEAPSKARTSPINPPKRSGTSGAKVRVVEREVVLYKGTGDEHDHIAEAEWFEENERAEWEIARTTARFEVPVAEPKIEIHRKSSNNQWYLQVHKDGVRGIAFTCHMTDAQARALRNALVALEGLDDET